MASINEDDFCSEMRNNTQKIHDESDKLINLKIVAALTDVKVWSQAIADFYFVFRQIEIALEKLKSDARLNVLHFCAEPEFRRTELFQKDLQYYMGDDWMTTAKPSEVAVNYCARIEEVSNTKPVLIIAFVNFSFIFLRLFFKSFLRY
ncbi:hypothetical protein HELRODRAFT_70990 [Helobdella robusta]|uniref:Uncharacterized protein n=1 Tax=Helobdella robusta TaxID=6412 RepID=T1G0F4_HELRO|nr:hypothetical protein HELRODRAFT_70990 [Helobdella robusta]ESN90403.1 hypothetical protein HELRODRAFT_70990 [Helobdella robusta]